MNDTTERIVGGVAAIVLAVGIGIALLWKSFICPWLLTLDWYHLGKIGAMSLALLIVLLFMIKMIRKKVRRVRNEKRERKKILENARKALQEKLKTKFYGHSWEIEEEFEELKESIKKLPREVQDESKQDIQEFYKKTKGQIKQLEEDEDEERREREEEGKIRALEEMRFKKQVSELFAFKKQKKSLEALPLNKKYSDDVIREAKKRMKELLREEKRTRQIRKEAKEYYAKNDLDTKPDIDEETEEIYLQVRQEILDGKLQRKKKSKGVIEDVEPLPKPLYRAKEMNENMKKRAVALGYMHARGLELDGKPCGGGFYIKPTMEKESPRHFTLKYLFAELHPSMKLEWGKDGKRTDVAFRNKKLKLAIEVETGTNNEKQLAAKTKWLKKHFDCWIFVCSRDNVKKYSKWADKKRSFCLTPKAAKKKVKSLIK